MCWLPSVGQVELGRSVCGIRFPGFVCEVGFWWIHMELGVQLTKISWKHRTSVMHGQQMPCPVEPWKHLCKRQSWRNVWVSFPWKEPNLASDSVGFLMLAVRASLANWQRAIRLNLRLSLLLCRRVYPSCVVSICKFTSLLKRILEFFASLLWIAKYF